MLFLAQDIGGTITVMAPQRPDASPTVQVLRNGGTVVAALTAATLDSVSTTTTTGATAGETSELTLTDATGVIPGNQYLVGAANRVTDFVKVKAVAGNVVTLQHPVLYDYAIGVAFVGTYVSYTLAAAAATPASQDWQARFSWKVSTVSKPELIVRFDVVRYAPVTAHPGFVAAPIFTLNDVRAVEPLVTQDLADTFDYEAAFAMARNDVVRDIGTTLTPGAMVYDDDYQQLGVHRFLAFYAGPLLGDRFEGTQELWRDRYTERLSVLKSEAKVDANQNLVVEPHEKGWSGSAFAWRA